MDEYYITLKNSILPPDNVLKLLESLKKDTSNKDLHIKKSFFNETSVSGFINLLNTTSITNLTLKINEFDYYCKNWNSEYESLFIKMIKNQVLHSEMYTKLIIKLDDKQVLNILNILIDSDNNFEECKNISKFIYILTNYSKFIKYILTKIETTKELNLLFSFVINIVQNKNKNKNELIQIFLLKIKCIINELDDSYINKLNTKTLMLYYDYIDLIE